MSVLTKTAASMVAAAALLASATAVSAQSFEGGQARASVSLNVRSGPGTSNGVVDVLTPGERVSVEQCRSNGWCYIEHSGPDGWVSSRYLDGVTSRAPSGNQGSSGLANGSARATVALNVRSGPGTGNRIVNALYEGQQVDVTECRSNGWCRVDTGSGSGWVASRYLEPTSGGSGGSNRPSPSGIANGAAVSTAALNVRSGPGTNYRIVDALFSGERVNVSECRSNGWCQISSSDGSGWVARRYLRSASGSSNEPDVGISINAPGFSFSIGTGGDFNQRPPQRNPDGQVCFYEHFDYDGASFCAQPGDGDDQLQSFNDRISSVRISGNAEVQVCEDFNFQGRCAVLSSSQARFSDQNNDIISSYRVR